MEAGRAPWPLRPFSLSEAQKPQDEDFTSVHSSIQDTPSLSSRRLVPATESCPAQPARGERTQPTRQEDTLGPNPKEEQAPPRRPIRAPGTAGAKALGPRRGRARG